MHRAFVKTIAMLLFPHFLSFLKTSLIAGHIFVNLMNSLFVYVGKNFSYNITEAFFRNPFKINI